MNNKNKHIEISEGDRSVKFSSLPQAGASFLCAMLLFGSVFHSNILLSAFCGFIVVLALMSGPARRLLLNSVMKNYSVVLLLVGSIFSYIALSYNEVFFIIPVICSAVWWGKLWNLVDEGK